MKKNKIIFSAQDVGGFNALLPVIKRLRVNKNFDLTLVLAGPACRLAKKQRIPYLNADKLSLYSKLNSLINQKKPDLIFTATSFDDLERKLIKIGRKNKIPTVSIVDFWSNYRLRFSDKNTNNLNYLPDYILAIDEIMKQEMVIEGIPSQKIFITGHPAFDALKPKSKSKKKGSLITFFCQPFSELFKKNNKGYLGFDEIEVFKDLVEALEKLKVKAPLAIKFHPRTKNLNKFEEIIKKSGLKIYIEKKRLSEDLIKKSKLIVGMNSMILFQAAMTGAPVLSYQSNLRKLDHLISNRLGLSTAVYEKKNLGPALKKLLLNKLRKGNLALVQKYTQNKSTEKVINFIKNIIFDKKQNL